MHRTLFLLPMLAALTALAGCATTDPCEGAGGYYSDSRSGPPLVLPDGLSPPGRSDALNIPPIGPPADQPDPLHRPDGGCILTPPPFDAQPAG
ncbi:MAG: hypothetical protein SV108_00165 [Pseudomonadota bacterium]|nr:hypothetical protein [Pseudomonadota bacterium]HJO36753.1 hypothetical protein [Gammaproteobacteria bacterium]